MGRLDSCFALFTGYGWPSSSDALDPDGVGVCDGQDNDCDGETDEGWTVGGEYALDEACGNCFTDCTEIYDLPNAAGYCDSTGEPTCSRSLHAAATVVATWTSRGLGYDFLGFRCCSSA